MVDPPWEMGAHYSPILPIGKTMPRTGAMLTSWYHGRSNSETVMCKTVVSLGVIPCVGQDLVEMDETVCLDEDRTELRIVSRRSRRDHGGCYQVRLNVAKDSQLRPASVLVSLEVLFYPEKIVTRGVPCLDAR